MGFLAGLEYLAFSTCGVVSNFFFLYQEPAICQAPWLDSMPKIKSLISESLGSNWRDGLKIIVLIIIAIIY